MYKCKWCDKKGFFLHLTINGLCQDCNPKVVKDILDNGKIFQECAHDLNYSIIPKLGLELVHKIKTSLSLLKQYEDKNIPTISPLPSELLNENKYSSQGYSIDELENRLNEKQIKFNQGLLTLNCKLYCDDLVKLEGDFIYDENSKSFTQLNKSEPNPHTAPHCHYNKISIEFSKEYDSGYYREYYLSNKLKREVPFIKDIEGQVLYAEGIERIYYEDLDSNGKDTYTLLEEIPFKKSNRCGISTTYSIDGGVLEKKDWDSMTSTESSLFYGTDRKEYYPETGSLKLEEYNEWGKEYYPNLSLKAEWKNKSYMKCGEYKEYHENGNVKMTVNYVLIDGIGTRDGLMYKYFDDGKVAELWSYNKGKRIFVKKYFYSGALKTEWLYDSEGNEVSKTYFNVDGTKRKK
jgi:antitoxin component YwqK of YwqJK toxin-antitoxin module